MDSDKPENKEQASQWMTDVNETLDSLVDDVDELKGKIKTGFLALSALGGVAALEGLGIMTLFKTQKAVIDTLQQIASAIQPTPMPPAEEARARQVMETGINTPMDPNPNKVEPTIVTGDVAAAVETPLTETPHWVKKAMDSDPDWTLLEPDVGKESSP
jgi:hypothetical protein